MPAPKSAGPKWAIAIVLSLISLILILINLLSGVGGHLLGSYITTDTTDLAIPAKLGSSVFLQDLSRITGNNLVGQDRTRESLGLSSTYRISLLTACGQDGGSTTCYAPRVGFTFDPSLDLKLVGTAAQGALSTAYYDQLHTYAAVSTFVAVAYIVASFLTVLTCIALVVSRRFARAAAISRINSGIVAILVLAATIASIVTFVKVRDAFNTALGEIGVKTTISASALALSAAASVASLLAFVLVLLIRPATSSSYGQSYGRDKGVGGMGGADEAGLMSQKPRAAGVGVGILERVQTWNRPRYAQLDANKPSGAHSRDHSADSDREGLINPANDDAPHDSLGPNSYPQPPWAKKQGRQDLEHVPTAYDPSPSSF
ncbi:SUR7/PalI family-domain-containing protein [Nemania sp. NC0429]|nr:SUR7/PalI family-domain-containing protein [Nemania sp. NC0429]